MDVSPFACLPPRLLIWLRHCGTSVDSGAVFSKLDWHLTAVSRKQSISKDGMLAFRGSPQCAKWITLQVVDAEFRSDFRIHGIFQLIE